jgi:diaminopimelate decarboxylase
MDTFFPYRQGNMYAEQVPLALVAERVGTPCYVYSRAAVECAWQDYEDAFAAHPHLICYAVKANSNLAILNLLARRNAGFDLVSLGELERVLRAGGDPSRMVFAGVGKRADEMQRALDIGIRCFNVESDSELTRLNEVAARFKKKAPVSLRVNPDVDPKTHPYIATGLKENKFGIPIREALEQYQRAAQMPHIEICGVGCHIGSQLTTVDPFLASLDRLLELAAELERLGVGVRHLDLGGGLGIRYRDETPPRIQDLAGPVLARLGGKDYELLLEPGRSVVGNAAILLTRVEYIKRGEDKAFAVVDAAMNDLLRPSLYGAWQDILPVRRREAPVQHYDVVGPVCESGDFLGKNRPLAVEEGDLLAIGSAGAYGFSMSSTYNSRPRAAEIMVDGDQMHVIRARETIAELMHGESMLPT